MSYVVQRFLSKFLFSVLWCPKPDLRLLKTQKNQRKLRFRGLLAVRHFTLSMMVAIWFCNCCIAFKMVLWSLEMALLKNTGKIEILGLFGLPKPFSFVRGLLVRVVFFFREHPPLSFSLSVSRLKNVAKFDVLGFFSFHDFLAFFLVVRILASFFVWFREAL